MVGRQQQRRLAGKKTLFSHPEPVKQREEIKNDTDEEEEEEIKRPK